MRSRAFRPIATLLSLMLLAGSPVHAGPVAIREVIQVISSSQNPPELRLRSVSQISGAPLSGAGGDTRVDSRVTAATNATSVEIDDNSAGSLSGANDTLLSGVALNTDDPQAGIDIIGEGDLEGTICDCGEITVGGGGIPKWPLLFLAAIPFFFIHGCDDCETPTPTPTIPETPEIPEPTSLLLFGSGLAAFGAGLRRRYARAKLEAQIAEEA